MSDLLNQTPNAREWADDAIRRRSGGIFGKLVPAVVWSDARGEDGESLVPINPVELVSRINNNHLLLLHNHDPGHPKGQVLEAASFETEDGEKFVAAILGFYAGGYVSNFKDLGLDPAETIAPPEVLPGSWSRRK